jgi:hypothetical protein
MDTTINKKKEPVDWSKPLGYKEPEKEQSFVAKAENQLGNQMVKQQQEVIMAGTPTQLSMREQIMAGTKQPVQATTPAPAPVPDPPKPQPDPEQKPKPTVEEEW